MERIATFTWEAKSPVVVDEELAVYDDGSAWLVVRAPREQRGPIGTYKAGLSTDDVQSLATDRGRHVKFVIGPAAGAGDDDAGDRQLAERIAALCRETPESLAAFHVLPSGPPKGGRIELALVAIGGGTRPAEFDLDHAACSVHFHAGREEVGWRECPEFPTGFVTVEAVGLGGVGRPAAIEPGSHGVIAFGVGSVDGADSLSMRVAGWLRAALPDAEQPSRFSTFTDARNIAP